MALSYQACRKDLSSDWAQGCIDAVNYSGPKAIPVGGSGSILSVKFELENL